MVRNGTGFMESGAPTPHSRNLHSSGVLGRTHGLEGANALLGDLEEALAATAALVCCPGRGTCPKVECAGAVVQSVGEIIL